jgi:predicted N-formylglutamate amidohydrolase
MPGTVRRVKQTITQLIDDIDGGKAEETVLFAIDGTNYEIDLSRRNAARLRDLLNGYTPYARAVRGGVQQRRRRRRRAAPTTTTSFVEVDNRAVRAWAASNGIELSTRGRIPASVIEQYRAAGN